MSRAINHLFPLEIQAVQSEGVETKSKKSIGTSDVDVELKVDSQPLRKAAILARKRIGEQLSDQAMTVVFSFPRECHEERE